MRRGDLVTIAGRVGGDYDGKPRPAVIIQSDDFPETDSVTVSLLTSIGIDAPLLRLRIDPTPTNIERAVNAVQQRGMTTAKAINDLAQLLATFGREDEVYELIMGWQRTDQAGAMSGMLFRPTMRKFRSHPRFMRVAAHLGLLRHWQNSGKWPDFCSQPDLGYDCKAEAAKLARAGTG